MEAKTPSIGEIVKSIRGDTRQGVFAKQLGISQAHLSMIEADKKRPGLKVVKKLAQISGLDAVTFID